MDRWTQEQTEALRSLWQSGATAKVIANHLGMSRNAVLGRAGRLGLNRTGKPSHGGKALPAERPWWNASEEQRRQVFASMAANGARKALEAAGL